MNKKLVVEFQNILKQNKLAHAYLFDGGSKKTRRDFALFLAKSQFCTNVQDYLPCGECTACKNVDLGDNPDVLELNTDKRSIGIDDVKLYKESMFKSSQGKVKVLIIDDAEKLTPQAANNLLKFIEEPEGNVLVMLLTNFKNQILPTILSRVQIFKLETLDETSAISELVERGFSDKNANLIVKVTEIKNIENLSDQDFTNFLQIVEDWFNKCLTNDSNAFINIQRRIKPLVITRNQQLLVWDLIGKMFSDVLAIKYDFGQVVILPRNIDLNITSKELTRRIDSYLLALQEWKSNVAFQACLESLTLTLINN